LPHIGLRPTQNALRVHLTAFLGLPRPRKRIQKRLAEQLPVENWLAAPLDSIARGL